MNCPKCDGPSFVVDDDKHPYIERACNNGLNCTMVSWIEISDMEAYLDG